MYIVKIPFKKNFILNFEEFYEKNHICFTIVQIILLISVVDSEPRTVEPPYFAEAGAGAGAVIFVKKTAPAPD